MTNPTVLIVDDNAQNVELLRAYLEDQSFNLICAADGLEALAEIERRRPDIVLLDIMMPRMSGLQVCKRLKSSEGTADIPVLIITALGEVSDVEAARDAGADDFISKPVSRFELVARVKWLLDSRGM